MCVDFADILLMIDEILDYASSRLSSWSQKTICTQQLQFLNEQDKNSFELMNLKVKMDDRNDVSLINLSKPFLLIKFTNKNPFIPEPRDKFCQITKFIPKKHFGNLENCFK